MMRIFRTAATVTAMVIAAAAAAQSGWTRIGHRQVSDSVDRDTIPAREPGEFRQLMICVEDAPVRFHEVVIRYRNGGTQNVRLRERIEAGGCTRDVVLRGRDRDIEAVDLTYEAASLGRGRAQVGLFAR